MKKTIALIVAALLLAACATDSNEECEAARFALDKGDWNSAISSATAAFDRDRSNVDAAMLLSSGYAGRAGVEVVELGADISKEENSEEEYKVVHTALIRALVDAIRSLADMRQSIVVLDAELSPKPASTSWYYDEWMFQLGMLEAIEAFALPSIRAQPVNDGPIDVTAITDDDKANAQNDMIFGDDNLIASGMEEDNDIIKNLRLNYCVLHNITPDASGFEKASLQDLVLCELSPDPDALGPGDFQSSFIDECGDFNFDACRGSGDTT